MVYSPGCGGCYLNRNRNSRSVLGIDYTIARARAAHMNQIKDSRRIFYREEKEEEEETKKGWEGKKGKRKEEVIASSLISSMYENKSNLCIRTWGMTHCRLDGREKPQKRVENRTRLQTAASYGLRKVARRAIATIGIAKLIRQGIFLVMIAPVVA